MKDGQLIIKPHIEKKGNDVKIHVPSFPLIQQLKQKYEQDKKIKNGKRDIQ